MAWEYLRFFHIAIAFLYVGAVALAVYGQQRAVRSRSPQVFEIYLRTAAFGGMMAGVGIVLASVFGVLTAWQQGWPLTSTGWLLGAYISVFVMLFLGIFVQRRNTNKALALLPQAQETGQVLPEQFRLIDGLAARLTNLLSMGLLVFVIVLMVFRPF